MSPCRRVGTNTCSTYDSNVTASVAPSKARQPPPPPRRTAAVRVTDFQWPCGGGRVEGGLLAAAVRLGRDRAGVSSALQQAVHPGDPDAEPLGDLFSGSLAAIAGGDDPLSEVHRIGFHRLASPPDLMIRK